MCIRDRYEHYISNDIFAGYEYPMSLRAFEKRSFNKFKGYPNTSVNVYTFEANGTITPMQISGIYDAE